MSSKRGPSYDCQACGACCQNPKHNRDHGIVDYVQLFPADALFQKKGLRSKWAVRNEHGEWHMKMDDGGLCAAFEGRIRTHAACGIYSTRPGVCRKLEPGTAQCVEARVEHGLSPKP